MEDIILAAYFTSEFICEKKTKDRVIRFNVALVEPYYTRYYWRRHNDTTRL